jgi:hypothetical protein
LNFCDPFFVEDEKTEKVVLDEENLTRNKLIGRLSVGIYKWKTRREHGVWISCGQKHKNGKEKSMSWAYQIVTSAKMFNLNPWQFAGVAANESGFDECSLGRHPRNLAYEKGYLKKNRRFLSYKRKDIIAFFKSEIAQRLFSRSGMDVGGWQLLSKHHHLKKYSIEQILSLDPGTHIAALHANRLKKNYNTICPFGLWRPSKRDWYQNKINRRAKKLGAASGEVFACGWSYK